MTPLEDLLQQCTVKITVPGGWGTGFFVAPGLILTCAHVVRKAADLQVTVSYPAWQQPLSAIVKAKADDGKTLDLALVELSEPLTDHPCVLLDEEPVAIGQALYSYGYLESYTNAAPVRPVNEGLTGDTPPLLKLQGAQVEKGISGAALLNLKTGKVCGMVKETRATGFDLGGGAIPTRVILEQFPDLRQLQQQFHGGDRRWLNLITTQAEIDFQPYLQAILANEDYREWQEVYTPTTVENRRRMPVENTATASERRFSSRLKLRAEMIKPDKQEQGNRDRAAEPPEQVEQWDVLAGLRNYATDHVVLIGKPGSGKSTSLERLLWEEADKALQNPNARIPVLVKLRRCAGMIEELIRDFLMRHQAALEIVQIEELLRQGKFLLLLDGLNELPKAFETEIANFRDRYRNTTPMIVSTRDLGEGGTLGIEKTLKMLPLTEPQMREFVRGYLGEEGDRLFQKLQGDRLRKFAETPLLLWMLCRVFAHNGKVPDNLGFAFREFAQLHDQELQADVPADSREQWHRLLRHLAFVMMQGKTEIDPQLSIPKEEAEDCLAAYLQQVGWSNPRECAERWLQDLLRYHLIQPVIQPNFEEHIEFRHQLIQEYYAAEYLLRLLPNLTDDKLKRDYLNYLKWTEPIALMLAMLDDEAQALRVVQLALQLDLRLGARLASEVKPSLQAQTVKFVEDLDVPNWLKVELLGEAKIENATHILTKFLNHSDMSLRQGVVWALGKIGSAQAVDLLIKLLDDPAMSVRKKAITVLGEIDSAQAVDALIHVWTSEKTILSNHAADILAEALKKQNPTTLNHVGKVLVDLNTDRVSDNLVQFLSRSAFNGQQIIAQSQKKNIFNNRPEQKEEIQSDESIAQLIQDLNNSHPGVRQSAANALIEISSEQVVSTLIQVFNDLSRDGRRAALKVFYKTRSKQAFPVVVQTLNDSKSNLRLLAAVVLGKIGDEETISALVQALNDSDPDVCRAAANGIGAIEFEEAIPTLIQLFNNLDSVVSKNLRTSVQQKIVEVLARIGSKEASPILIQALKCPSSKVRRATALALGKIGSEEAIPALVQALKCSSPKVCRAAALALGEIGSEEVVPALLQTLSNSNHIDLQRRIIEALGRIGSEEAIPTLIRILNDSSSNLRRIAVTALGQIKSKESIPALLQALNDSSFVSRQSVIEALGEIGSEEVVPALIQVFNDSEVNVSQASENAFLRRIAATALGKIRSKKSIPALLQALNDSSFVVRQSVVEALGEIGSEEAIPALIQTLNDSEVSVRRASVNALGGIGSEQVIPALIQTLDNSNASVRWLAASVLGEIGSEEAVSALRKALSNSSPKVCENAAMILNKIGSEQAISILMQALVSPEINRYEVVEKTLLENRSEPFVIALKQALSSLEFYASESQSKLLQEITPKQSIPILIKSLDHPNANEREQAVQALGETRSNQAIDGLIRLMNDPVSFVRGSAAQALGEIRSEQAINPLIQALSDPVSGVRWRVADALGNIASERAIHPLVKALEDSDAVVRETVAESLGKIKGDKTAQQLPTLLKMLPGKGGQEVMLAVAAIQNHCQFYNYEIWQAHLEAQKADRQTHLNRDPNAITIQTLERLTIMTDKSPIFNQQHATIGVNYAAEGSTIEFTQHTSSSEQTFEILLTDYQRFIQQLQEKYPTLADATTVPQIIEVEAKLIEAQDHQRWQNFLNLKRLWNGGKKAGVKVGEHFAENNVWAKGAIAFLEGVSEDAK